MQKATAVYRNADDITNLKIRIKIKEINGSSEDSVEEVKTFRWQQKIYGQSERNFYRDKKNCVTDLEKKYYGEILKLPEKNDILFSYVDEDEYDVDNFHKSSHSLNNYEVMHLMADLGEFEAATKLCTIKYDCIQKLLTIFPDFTQSEPYYVDVEGDVKKMYQYWIDDVSEKIPYDVLLKENEILDKITAHEIKQRLKKAGTDFIIPAKSKLNVYLFLEILHGQNFEYNNVYVQYFIDLPQNWTCKNSSALKGCTQTSHSSSKDGLSYFGLPFEVFLEYDIQNIDEIDTLQAPYIYFEVVSKATWNRFRSEGFSYTILPISQAGVYNYELQCSRIIPKGLEGNLRRFFIGDFSNNFDMTWLSIPKDYEKNYINKFGIDTVGSGRINIRINVLQQSRAFLDFTTESTGKHKKFILEKLNTSILIKSVEQVVAAFKIAKRKMIEVRKNV